MTARDPRIDTHIEQAAPFARPLLQALRERFHAAGPPLDESIKWGMPAFLYRGRLLGGMAAFKQHAALNFWHAGQTEAREAMGQFGHLATLGDLSDEASLRSLVQDGVARIEAGTPRRPKGASRPAFEPPTDFAAALASMPQAKAHFDAFTPGQRREYVEWILEAKRAPTRARRIEHAVTQLAEGTPHNWKYLGR